MGVLVDGGLYLYSGSHLMFRAIYGMGVVFLAIGAANLYIGIGLNRLRMWARRATMWLVPIENIALLVQLILFANIIGNFINEFIYTLVLGVASSILIFIFLTCEPVVDEFKNAEEKLMRERAMDERSTSEAI